MCIRVNQWMTVCVAMIAFIAISSHALEKPAPTDDQLKAWVKELGDDDFAKRLAAEKELSKAGAKAEIVLKASLTSADPQVKATAARLLGRLRLATIGAMDYLQVVPANSIIVLQLKNLSTSLENAKKTAIGQIILSKDLEPFRTKVDAMMNQEPQKKKEALLWFQRFKGQFTVSLWELNLLNPEELKFGAILEITDPNPVDVFDELLTKTGVLAGGRKTTNYKDVDILNDPLGAGPAVALIGRHILVSNTLESVQKLVDGFIQPGGFAATPDFKKALPHLGTQPDMIFGMDFQKYMKAAQAVAPMPGYDELMKGAGVTAKYLYMTSSSAADTFEDRFYVVNDGPPKGFAAAARPPADAPPPLTDMALMPANSILAAVGYLDGSQMNAAMGDYLGGLKKMMDQVKKQGPGPVPIPDFSEAIAQFEAKSGLKVGDLAALVKGSIGYYAVLAPGGALAPPDLGLFITCEDAEKAKAVNAAISKGFNAYDNKNAVKEVDAPGHKIYQLDLTALGLPVQPNFPYSPCWTIEGNRVFVASSIQALRKQLSFIDNKTPGLLSQPDFVKALGALSPEERKGQIMYADMKSLLTFGATVGLPLLQAKVKDAEIKKNLATLPPATQLFKDVPPVLIASTFIGDANIGIMRSPVPPFQTVFLMAIGAGLAMPMMGGMPGGVGPELPPGGF